MLLVIDGWQIIDEYLVNLAAAGQRRSTIDLRADQLHHMATELGGSPELVDAERLTHWLGSQRWQRETLRSYRSAVRGFFRWATASGLMAADPAAHLARVPEVHGVPHPVPEHIYETVLGRVSTRVALMMRLAAEAGLRRAEVAAVHHRDVLDMPDGTVLMVHGKGGRDRFVPIGEGLAARIAAAPGWLFPSELGGHLSAQYVGVLVGDALPGKWTMHSLRHRFATQAYRGSRNLRAVQELLGHASVATTQRYTAVSSAELRAAVKYMLIFLAIILMGCSHEPVHNPIPAGATRDDIAFLAAMDEHDISNNNGSAAMINTAHELCGLLGMGMSVDGLAAHYSLSYKNLSAEEMRFFIHTSAASYCPQYLR